LGTRVRPATAADLDALCETLALAFDGDAWSEWTIEGDDRHARLRHLSRLFLSADALPHGEVWVTDGCEAVAVWQPPGHRGPADDVLETLGPAVARLHGARFDAAEDANAVVESLRPEEPHWYLGTLATHPGHRGRGLGTAVLQPVLRRADAEGTVAAGDTSCERNLPFFARQGFEVARQADVPGGGPHLWLLRRAPSG
jgi:GNAT superfamily N-acetyltransferase